MDDVAVINQKEPQDAAKKSQEIIAIITAELISAFHLKAMCDRTAEQDTDSLSQDSYVDKTMSKHDR